MGIGPGLLGGAIVKISKVLSAEYEIFCHKSKFEIIVIVCTIQQSSATKKAEAEKNADLPKVPGGALGSFKNGLQSVTDKVCVLFTNSWTAFNP